MLLLSHIHFYFAKNSLIGCMIAGGGQLGPNVSVSANARIGPGARLIGCIILDDVEIKVCVSFLT